MNESAAATTLEEEVPMETTTTETTNNVKIINAVNEEGNEQRIISAVNPTAEEMQELCDKVRQSSAFKVRTAGYKFNFKRTKDKETGIEIVRKPVEIPLAYPSTEGILTILKEGGKEAELLMEAVETVVNSHARDIIADDTSITAANFPYDKCTWHYIANMPKATRRGGGIPKETWDAFAVDYCQVMPQLTGRSVEQVTNAAKLLTAKLATCKTVKPVLELLVEQLSIYTESAPNASEFTDVIEFLASKADEHLNKSDEELLSNL